MTERRELNFEELTCEPLDSVHDLYLFLQNPPPWRSLCEELKHHSELAIVNKSLHTNFTEISLETPATFCHFDPEVEEAKRHLKKKLPMTLICHDLANGYHDDSFVDGTGTFDAYTFYNWAAVDIFCYFSHHLITIPPLGWINVGHAHGVKVIGTLITEWTEGCEFWEQILSTDGAWRKLASGLVELAKTLKFDGWLLNIENKVRNPDKLLEFVRYLHSLLHQELREPVLIWYDSVTVTGSLNWQNGLNEKNKSFFDACDGIFTNYSWNQEMVSSSARLAGDRRTDVYIGIDVWGRNFYGGGQFNTQKAVRVAHKYGCSLAIFAPAWTHEAIPDVGSDIETVTTSELNKYDQFLLRDRALWDSLWPYLYTKLPSALPFQTSFCRGQGKKRRLYGEVLCPVPWFNLRHMQYQPNSNHGPHGYIITTMENLYKVSQHKARTDAGGIIKYRKSFESIVSSQRTENISNQAAEGVNEDNNSVDSFTEDVVEHGESELDLATTSDEDKPIKGKKMNMLRALLLKIKFRKDSLKEIQNQGSDASLEENSLTHKSVVTLSLNLQLGNPRDRKKLSLATVPGEEPCLKPYFADSFIGGSCLLINPSDEVCTENKYIRLFHTDFCMKDSIAVCVVTKTLPYYDEQFLNLRLHVLDDKDQIKTLVLIGRSVPSTSRPGSGVGDTVCVNPINSSPNEVFKELQRYLLIEEPGFYVPVENSFGWIVRYYVLPVCCGRLTSINARAGLSSGPIMLGHIGLCDLRTSRPSDTANHPLVASRQSLRKEEHKVHFTKQ